MTHNTNAFFISFSIHTAIFLLLSYFIVNKIEAPNEPIKAISIALSSFQSVEQKESVVSKQVVSVVQKAIPKAKSTPKKAADEPINDMTQTPKVVTAHEPLNENRVEVLQSSSTSQAKEVKEESAKNEVLMQSIKQKDEQVKQTGISEEETQEFIKTNFQSIRDKVLDNLKYPNIARRMGQSGVVELVLVIDTNGKLLDILCPKSSGHQILDNSALEAAKKLASEVLPSPKVVTKITLPIKFALN